MAFFSLAGEITQVKESIPWVRCASGNVYVVLFDRFIKDSYKHIVTRGGKCVALNASVYYP